MPNGDKLRAIENDLLPLHYLLSEHAKKAHILEGLSYVSLLSIGKLCDDDCVAVFDKTHLCIYKQGILIIKGQRNWTDGLWDINIKPIRPQQSVNVITRKDKTKNYLAEYFHKCIFSPSISTFQREILQGHLLSWPGI